MMKSEAKWFIRKSNYSSCISLMERTENQCADLSGFYVGQALVKYSRIHRDFIKIRRRGFRCPACLLFHVTDSRQSFPNMPNLLECWTEIQNKMWLCEFV